ncbi:18175_t:CDS:10 [Racocetra fulgida]|uniref:18175_t:CDS:1 n=1 Tax=Racocetra fulgida TaxID=60492 RepID=A0A9N9AWW8_9GLOM|nr:18175_t:CDS:10 [Racocetra fulgida]
MSSTLPGFSSGSGRRINPLSEESINRARSFFEEDRKDPNNLPGFSFGNGRYVNPISEESLNRVRGLFDDDKDSGSLSGFSSVRTPKNLSGFSSGSGRYIGSLSEDQLNKARRLFDEKASCSNYTHKPNTPKRTIDNHSLHAPKKRKILQQNQNIMNSKTCLSAGQYCESTEVLSSWGASEAYTCLIERGANPNLIDEQVLYVWTGINCAHRSALKLIIEGDGNASWPMVLCVSNIFEDPDVQTTIPLAETCQIKYGLELTDTWYKIRASIDQPLQRAIMRSKIRIGYKLEIYGAKIVGGSTGLPALDISGSPIRLDISANSTKLAHWDAKLGVGRFRSYALLHSLSPDGGFIPAIDVVVQRKYPLLFRETMKDGTVIIRNAKGEEHAMKEHEVCGLKLSYRLELQSITAGDELYALIQNSGDISEFSKELSSLQIERLHEYIQRRNEEKAVKMSQWISEQSLYIENKRTVTAFFKIRVCDYHPYSSPIRGRDAIITIWNPDEFLINYLQEGRRYKPYFSDKFGKQIQFQNILALDSSEQIVQIEVKDSISVGMGKILKNTLAFSNLRYRNYDPKYAVYILSSCDETEIKMSPCETYLRQAMDDLENWITSNASVISKYEAIAMELCKSPFDNDIP